MTSPESRIVHATIQLDDGTVIRYVLHTPTQTVSGICKLALIAHPLGRLGGSKEDHVVTALATMLSNELGYIVCRYDARGAGESSGSASWT